MTNAWIEQMFTAQQVPKEGVIRRQRSDVEKYATVQELEDEVRRRGFHLVEIGGQLIVLCNTGAMRVIC